MARIPYFDFAAAPERVREQLDRLPVKLNVFRMLGHAETLVVPFLRLGTAILGSMKLDPRLREIVILRVASLSGSDYEWTQHVPLGKTLGLTDGQVAALGEGRLDAPGFDDTDRLVVRFVDEAVESPRVSEALFEAATARFSHQEVVELLLTVGYYMGLARVLESTAVDVDAPAATEIAAGLRRDS